MKKISLFIALIVILALSVYASVVYENTSNKFVAVGVSILAPGDTISVNRYLYQDDLTLKSGSVGIVMAAGTFQATSTTSAATPSYLTVEMSFLANVEVNIKVKNAAVNLYLNSLSASPILLEADSETRFYYSTEKLKSMIFEAESSSVTVNYTVLVSF